MTHVEDTGDLRRPYRCTILHYAVLLFRLLTDQAIRRLRGEDVVRLPLWYVPFRGDAVENDECVSDVTTVNGSHITIIALCPNLRLWCSHFSKAMEEHLDHGQQVMDRIAKH